MATAQRALDDANTASMNAYKAQLASISKTMDAQLSALQMKIAKTMAMLQSLGAASSAAGMGGFSGGVGQGGAGNGNGQFPPGALIPPVGGASYSVTNNVYPSDPSLPGITQATLSAITLGQTQGLLSNKRGQAVAL
jgi:hypothetical protein